MQVTVYHRRIAPARPPFPHLYQEPCILPSEFLPRVEDMLVSDNKQLHPELLATSLPTAC